MADVKFICLLCKQPLEVDENMLGQVVICPACKGRIQLSSSFGLPTSTIRPKFKHGQSEGRARYPTPEVRCQKSVWVSVTVLVVTALALLFVVLKASLSHHRQFQSTSNTSAVQMTTKVSDSKTSEQIIERQTREPVLPRQSVQRAESFTGTRALTDSGSRNVRSTSDLSKLLPAYTGGELDGNITVRIRNPNEFFVAVALRTGGKGKNFEVPANGTRNVSVPNGHYDIYFVYSDKTNALFQGDAFDLNNNGVEIQLVKAVDGNFGIRQVN